MHVCCMCVSIEKSGSLVVELRRGRGALPRWSVREAPPPAPTAPLPPPLAGASAARSPHSASTKDPRSATRADPRQELQLSRGAGSSAETRLENPALSESRESREKLAARWPRPFRAAC